MTLQQQHILTTACIAQAPNPECNSWDPLYTVQLPAGLSNYLTLTLDMGVQQVGGLPICIRASYPRCY